MYSLKLILTNTKYFSVAWVFASLNIIIGTWVLYVPYVKEKLELTNSQLGFALFCTALGILLFLPFVPYITKKMGLGRYTLTGVVIFSLTFVLPLFAQNYIMLCISLFLVGIFFGTTNVSMNALVSEMEKQDKVKFMSAVHGFFSLGGAIGAGLGSLFLNIFEEPWIHMSFMGLLTLLINLFLSVRYYHIIEEDIKVKKSSFKFKTIKPLLLIALIAFIVLMSEGSIEQWSSLYLLEEVKVSSNNFIGLGFIVFSIAMTIGRFFGDGVSKKIGSLKIIALGCLCASLGYLCILINGFTITIFGFGILGIGLSTIIPELFRIAGNTHGVKASEGISLVSGIGFIGFLAGPLILGLISDRFNIEMSFVFLLVLTLVALIVILIMYKLSSHKINNSNPK